MKFFSLLALALTGPALAAPSTTTADSAFQVYGFLSGDEFGSQTLFSDGKVAYLGDYKLLNNAEAAPVLLQKGDGAVSHWTATPGSTDGTSPSWPGLRIAVPSTSGETVFVNPDSADLSNLWDDFALYNPLVFVMDPSNSQLGDWWYAVPSGIEGVWKLLWWPNGDDTDGKIRISLRKSS